MEHIPTTASAAQNVKRAAKKRRKSSGESFAAALDAAAREAGYASWKHVTVCQAATLAPAPSAAGMPAVIQGFLAEQRAAGNASPDLLEALRSGLLFAMDVKAAESVAPESRDDITETEDAQSFLASDVWQAIERAAAEESDAGSAAVQSEPEEVLQTFLDDMANYRFFRYNGNVPKTLDAAFASVFKDFFFPPTHVWLAGKFINMADVRQVQVDGNVVYSFSPGGPVDSPLPLPASAPLQPDPTSFVSPAPARTFIAKLDVRKWEPGLYEYIVHDAGQELFAEAGFNSISEALKSASDIEGDLVGFEVSYAGYVVGTYPAGVLKASAEEVAQRAVDTASSMRWLE